jgi:hypothetical protein
MTSERLMNGGRQMEIGLDVNALLEGRIVTATTQYGESRHVKWECEDGYIVGYSTAPITRSNHEKYDGKFACIVWKPDNKKNPKRWKISYYRAFRQRKKAREYAEKFYYQHSPKKAARHGR